MLKSEFGIAGLDWTVSGNCRKAAGAIAPSVSLSLAIARICCDSLAIASGHLTFVKTVNKAKGIFSNELRQFYEVFCWIPRRRRGHWITA